MRPRHFNLWCLVLGLLAVMSDEKFSLGLRAESFNTYNAVIPGGPGTTIGNSSAGLATSLGNTPRELQFGAKITF